MPSVGTGVAIGDLHYLIMIRAEHPASAFESLQFRPQKCVYRHNYPQRATPDWIAAV
jgi:hypothetical protein